MPASFGDPAAEVNACRRGAAAFDYSFLLRLEVRGPHALAVVADFCGRDFTDLPVGRIRYALTTDARGWLVSDLTVWRTALDCLEVMSGRAADAPALVAAASGLEVAVRDLSDDTGIVALQGPDSEAVMHDAGCPHAAAVPFFGFSDMRIGAVPCRIARLGYTGLDGFEILCPGDRLADVWGILTRSARPGGFEAADRLRLLAGLPLFTREFLPPVSAKEAGYGHIRPLGEAPADTRPARVRRIGFRGRDLSDVTDARAPAHLLWRPGSTFPPESGNIAVTSLVRDDCPGGLLGMGYASCSVDATALREPGGRIELIEWSPLPARLGSSPPR